MAEGKTGGGEEKGKARLTVDSSPPDSRVALLFLTVGEVKNPTVWEKWLENVPAERYTVYVHAKEPDNVEHALFQDNLVRPEKTKWGTVSLVKAHVALIKEALCDARNWWFILLSDSCLPLVGFDTLLARLKSQYQLSSFDLHTGRAQRIERDNVRNIMADVLEQMTEVPGPDDAISQAPSHSPEEQLIKSLIDNDDITAHSQWCVLTRRDAETLCTGSDLEIWYRAYKQMLRLDLVKRSYLLAPDELFILTYLRHYYRTRHTHPYIYHNRKSTFAHCCLDMVNCECSLGRAAHPMTFRSLRKELVVHAVVAGSLFARKFDQGMKTDDLKALWAAMDREPTHVLEVAELSSALANPERLTQRQQISIAMKLSKSGHHDAPTSRPPESFALPSPDSNLHTHTLEPPLPQTPPPPQTPPLEEGDAAVDVEVLVGERHWGCIKLEMGGGVVKGGGGGCHAMRGGRSQM